MKFSVIIPTYNHCDDLLKPCLESISKYTTLNDIEILIVANGCTDNTEAYVKSLGEPFKLIWIKEPYGYTKSTNVGIKQSIGDYVILMNNDTILLEQPKDTWLKMLTDPFADSLIGITGPMMSVSPEAQKQFMIFFLACIKRAVIDNIGILDEIFSPGFGEDVDFCLRAEKAGWHMKQVPTIDKRYYADNRMVGGFPIYHAGEKTLSELPKGQELLTKNRIKLAKMYSPGIKLNLGCGDKLMSGYLNVDFYNSKSDLKLNVNDLSVFDKDSVEEIIGIHIFEHLSPYEVGDILNNWINIIKPGGKLILEMPDIKELCSHFANADKNGRYRILNCIYGTTQIAHGHLFGWYDEILTDHLIQAGFTDIKILPAQFEHWGYNMRVEANKPNKSIKNIPDKSKIYDCFMFHNELDALEIRLNELYDTVDHFVLVEATKSQTNKPKQLFFKDNKNRFNKFLDKIIHIVVDDMPDSNDAWEMERFQRTAIMRGLTKCKDNDIIIVSDGDEISKSSTIKEYKIEQGICSLIQKLHYYRLNCIGDGKDSKWNWSKILPYSLLKNIGTCKARYTEDAPEIQNAGWHFSYLGTPEFIANKIESWSHQEYNKPEFKNLQHITNAIDNAEDVFGRNIKFKYVDIDETYPKFIQDNKEIFIKKGLLKQMNQEIIKPEVTVTISTKDRYDSTLATTLISIAEQTYKPKHIIIFDDGEQKDLRKVPIFASIFLLYDAKNITWQFVFGQKKGQIFNHQAALSMAPTEWIWRIDDDEFASHDCLEKLVACIKSDTGAIGGKVLIPGFPLYKTKECSGLISMVSKAPNLQWSDYNGETLEIEHLHSTFLFRKEAAKAGYQMNLSPVAHREETIFSNQMVRNGWKVLFTPKAITWHLKNPMGGIRSYKNDKWYSDDEEIFKKYLNNNEFLVVLNNGMGDHAMFKSILPDIKKKLGGRKLIMAVCFPELFENETDIKLISIQDAINNGVDMDKYNIYKWCMDNKWQGHIIEAYKRMYL